MAARPRRPGDPRPHPSRSRYPSGNELRQTGDPDEQLRDLDAAFDRLARQARVGRVPRRSRPSEIMSRKNFAATGSFIAEDRPRALDLLGFASQLVFNTFHNRRLHDWEHGGDLDLALRRRPGPQPRRWSSSARSTRGCCRRCYVPLADFDRARGAWPTRRSSMGAAALLVASGCPPGHSPSHIGARPGVGAGRRRPGIPIVFHVGGTGDLHRPELLPQRPADPARLPRRRGELPLGRLHGHPRPARRRRWRR